MFHDQTPVEITLLFISYGGAAVAALIACVYLCLRINHFTELYRKAAAEGKPVAIAQEMALESGYHSYSTFSLAFKQRMGQTATVWMRDIIFAKTELE